MSAVYGISRVNLFVHGIYSPANRTASSAGKLKNSIIGFKCKLTSKIMAPVDPDFAHLRGSTTFLPSGVSFVEKLHIFYANERW